MKTPHGQVMARLFLIPLMLALPGCSDPETDFRKASEIGTEQAFQDFISRHSDDPLAEHARSNLVVIAYGNARRLNTERGWQGFLKRYPGSVHTSEARNNLVSAAFREASQQNTSTAYRRFLTNYPDSSLASQAREQIAVANLAEENALWKEAEQKKSDAGVYRDYLTRFPDGQYASLARDCVAWADAEASAGGDPAHAAVQAYLTAFPEGRFKERAEFYSKILPNLDPEVMQATLDRHKLDEYGGSIDLVSARRDVIEALNRRDLVPYIQEFSGLCSFDVRLVTGSVSVNNGRMVPTGMCSIRVHSNLRGELLAFYATATAGDYRVDLWEYLESPGRMRRVFGQRR